jgi:signal recognition particle receptor subunit beta
VVQFNKRDLKDIEPENKILDLWGPTGIPIVFASALQGRGVMESFREILKRCYRHLDETSDIGRKLGVGVLDFLRIAGVDDE